jgi:catechol 2,3-dioxygenase-like lactoylglutathione lyase family enzyme
MKVEHIAFVVDDPDAVAAWYCEHMGLRLVRQGPPPIKMTFLADSDGTMFEVYAQSTKIFRLTLNGFKRRARPWFWNQAQPRPVIRWPCCAIRGGWLCNW